MDHVVPVAGVCEVSTHVWTCTGVVAQEKRGLYALNLCQERWQDYCQDLAVFPRAPLLPNKGNDMLCPARS